MSILDSALDTLRDRGAAVLVSAALNLLRANLHRRVLRRDFLEKRIHGHRMMLDLADPGISRSLILFGTREVEHKLLLERIVRPGMTVLDVGANIGYYALMERGLVGDAGRVIAVEPSPANVALLRRNLELNGYGAVPVVEVAVSDEAGRKEFFLADASNLNTFHPAGSASSHMSGRTIDVSVRTVPDLAEEYGAPDLLRMDVEGHEVEVIRGVLDGVRAGKLSPTIIFETHLTRYSAGHDMEQVLRDAFAAGYTTRYMASSAQRGTALIEARGYVGSAPVATDGVERKIFENISNDDAIDFICHAGGARTVVLAPAADTQEQRTGAQ